MASVVTAVKPSASLTLDEYDPFELSLGLYGTQGTMTQEEQSIVDAVYTVDTVPGVVQVVDKNGDGLYSIKDVIVRPATATSASISAVSMTTALGSTGTLAISGSSAYTGTATKDYYVRINTAPTAAGDLAGMIVEVANSLVGPYTAYPAFGTGSTATLSVGNGISVDFTLTAAKTFAKSEIYTFKATAALTAYTAGTDYVVETQSSRAGLIKIPKNSTIKAGTSVKISVTVPAGKFPKISGGSAGEIEGKLLFIGDPNIGGKYNIEAWKCKVTPDGALTGLIGTEFGNFKLTVSFESDYENHPEEPYYKAVLVG